MPVPVRVLLIAAIGYGAACSSLGPETGAEEEEAPVVVEPVVEPEPAVIAEPEPGLADEEPAREVAPPRRILVLSSSEAASYAAISSVLDEHLKDRYDVAHVNYSDLDATALENLGHADAVAVIAIGLDAARFVTEKLTLPTIVCQIYDLEPLLAQRDTVFGVAALPPPQLQLRAWQQLAPGVATAGLFVSEDESDIVAAARQAAAEVGLELHVEFAASDRELLYRFKRVAPQLDGLWLVPDNDILSPPVLRELFSYATVHRVHSIVFNPSLLSWGALLSVGANAENVAGTVANVLDRIISGETVGLPRISPLTAVDTQVNGEIATALGLGDPSRLPGRNEVALK